MPLTAIVLAAGEGTRMKSRHPKVMHKLMEKPLVWWPVRAAREAGAERIVVVVGSGSAEMRSFFADSTDVELVEQTERLGTGHAVRVALDATGPLEGPVVVLYGDTPLMRPSTIRTLVDETVSCDRACTVLAMTPPDPTGYGRIDRAEDGQVRAIIEHKDCTPEQQAALTECNSGVYCFDGAQLSANIGRLNTNNAQGEYYVTDMIGILAGQGASVTSVLCDDYSELLGVNSRVQLAEATKIMQARTNERLMAEGVTMLDPSTVWVGPEVSVGRDTIIYPMTMLWGTTTIGEECVVGPNSRLTNATVGNGCTVDETVVVDSTIDDGVNCGPRAYLRGGAHMMAGSKVGTHVEIKGSTVGEGSKVPHLSYIGDCRMGAGVNIGGGSITCNYDGKHKSRTTIGDGVFIGSDTMMVAPVTIGDHALIGAASCITEDVPAGALSLERSKQTTIEDWATAYWDKLKRED